MCIRDSYEPVSGGGRGRPARPPDAAPHGANQLQRTRLASGHRRRRLPWAPPTCSGPSGTAQPRRPFLALLDLTDRLGAADQAVRRGAVGRARRSGRGRGRAGHRRGRSGGPPRLRRQPAASPPRSGPGAGAAGQPDRTGLAAGARGFRGLGRRFRAVRRGDGRGGQRRTRPVSGNAAPEQMLQRMGGEQNLVDAFFATIMSLMAMVVTIHAVQLMVRGEDTGSHAEEVLATAVSRRRFAVSHLGPALVGPLVLMALTGVAAGVPYAVISGNGGQVWRVLASAVLFVPAMWVLVGAAMALIGLLPRFTTAAWALLAGFAVLGEIGPLLKLPTAVLKVSPYANVPSLLADTVTWTPLVVLLGAAAVLTGVGLAAYDRRDIA